MKKYYAFLLTVLLFGCAGALSAPPSQPPVVVVTIDPNRCLPGWIDITDQIKPAENGQEAAAVCVRLKTSAPKPADE